jgi:hypothetical protein
MVSKVFLNELSLNFDRVKKDYLTHKMQQKYHMPVPQNASEKMVTTFKQEGEMLLTKLTKLEHDYEIGLKQKLEDTALRISELGGVCEKAMFKCRKLEYFGDAGDIYFE